MKKLLFIPAIALLLAGGVASCNNNENESDVEVSYKPCPCDEEMPLWETQLFQRGEAYLFKDYIPEQMENQINSKIYSDRFTKVCWIIYDSETGVANIYIANLFYPEGGNIMSVGLICNFPDAAKGWAIPKNGCRVDLEGLMYKDCNTPSLANVVKIGYVLTKLKRR